MANFRILVLRFRLAVDICRHCRRETLKRSKSAKKPWAVETEGNVTVKIYKRDGETARGESRSIFEIADYTSGSRQLRGFNDAAEARTEAKRIASQIATGKTTAASMSNAEAASFGRAIELLKPTGIPIEVAAAHIAKAVRILGSDRMVEAAKFLARHQPDRMEQRKVSEAVTELVTLKESRDMSEDYTNDLRQRLTRFAKAFSVDISTVTTGDVQRWLDGLKLGSQSVKNFRTVLYTLFEFAEARGYILKGSNPVVSTEAVTEPVPTCVFPQIPTSASGDLGK